MASTPQKILLFKIGALGDVLMTTPLVRQLRRELARSTIVYYVGEYAADVLRGSPYLDRVEVFDQRILYGKRAIQAVSLWSRIRSEKFDLAFVLDKHVGYGLFLRLCGVPVRVGFDRDGEGRFHTHTVAYGPARHEVHYYLSLLGALGLRTDLEDTDLDLPLSDHDFAFARSFFATHDLVGDVIGVVPGGGTNPNETEPIRRWAPAKCIDLVRDLAATHKVLLLGGPEDRELCDRIAATSNSRNVVSAAGMTTRMQSAALMQRCAVVVCSDSGPMHLASAVHDRIVSLFGPTDPQRKAPLHRDSISIWHDQELYEEAYEIDGEPPSGWKRDRWMESITVHEVEAAVAELLRR